MKLSAILLSGGLSSRMGRDKAELDFGGLRLVQAQVRKLQNLEIEDIVVCGYAGTLTGARTVPDVYPHRGPLGGIHAGLLAIHEASALILPVDTPLIPKRHLRALIDAHKGGITVTVCQGKAEPLIGVYDKNLSVICEEILQGSSSSVRELFSRAKLTMFPYTGDERLLINGNTPEDYAEILSLRVFEDP